MEEIKSGDGNFYTSGASYFSPAREELALDGEREIILREGENWEIRLEDTGPRRVDVEKLMSLVQERSVINGSKGNHAQIRFNHGRRNYQ